MHCAAFPCRFYAHVRRRSPTLSILKAPAQLGATPSGSARFVVTVSLPAPGVAVNVSAVVTNDTGSVVVTLPPGPRGVLAAEGLTPGLDYTMRATCVDSLGGVCPDVTYKWRTAACVLPESEAPSGLQAVSVVPGERFVTWAYTAAALEYSVDGGPWTREVEAPAEVSGSGVLVRAHACRAGQLSLPACRSSFLCPAVCHRVCVHVTGP